MAETKKEMDRLQSVIDRAVKNGYDKEGLFVETLEAYRKQTDQLRELARKIEKYGVLYETKTTNGDPKLQSNPAVADYTKVSTARNGTAATLLKIEERYSKPTQAGKLGDFLD